MLATLVDQPFSDPDWVFEPKLDGVRCLTFRKGRSLRLLSRNEKELNQTYPELESPLVNQKVRNYIADGEIVAFRGSVTSFAELQRRMQMRNPDEALRAGVAVFYYLFDLLYLDGYDLRQLPLIHRKTILSQVFECRDPLRLVIHREEKGEADYEDACTRGLEGIIAKRAGSVYVAKRSRDWLKIKCWASQEFVIGGYTEPKGERTGFGALLIGYYEEGKLRYAGKVGTGFDTDLLIRLAKELSSLETKSSPFTEETRRGKGVHWVKPKLVAQLSFTEWTRDGRLRHPRFLGIRKDKSARDVKRERPKSV